MAKPVYTQSTPAPVQPSATEPQAPGDTTQQPTVTVPAERKPDEQTELKKGDKEKKHHRGSIVIAPLPIVSPAIGSGVSPVAGYIFPFQEKVKISPPSVITNNGTRGFGLGADLYIKEDRYELKSFYGHGNVDYKLYGVGYANGNN